MITLIIASALLIAGSIIGSKTEGKNDAINGTDPEHWKDWLVRLITALPSVWLTIDYWFYRYLPDSEDFLYSPLFKSIIAGAFLIIGMGLIYAYFLNTTYNKYKGKPKDYLGMMPPASIYGNTATTDKIAHKWGIAKFMIKIELLGGIVFCFFFYAWTIHNILNPSI